MKNAIELGMNRSGMATAPRMGPEALQVPKLTQRTLGDGTGIASERIVYCKSAEPVATMPPPGSLKELATTTLKLLKGEKAIVLTDKVGERMAFERGGVRLYEALVSKLEAFGSWERGPTRAELDDIYRDELKHFHLLTEVMEVLGADPTAVTPSAEVQDVVATGLRMVISNPAINLQQSLEAILVAELADNDGWHNLVRLAAGYGEQRLASRFQQCLDEERVHLARVRGWVASALSNDAFSDSTRLLQHAEPWLSSPMTNASVVRKAAPVRKAGGRSKARGHVSRGRGRRNGNGANRRR